MTNEIQKREDFKTKLEQVRLLFPTLSKVKDEEVIKALSVAKHLGLDPTKKEVHFIGNVKISKMAFCNLCLN